MIRKQTPTDRHPFNSFSPGQPG